MTVLNTLILHLKSFKGLGRKKIFSLIWGSLEALQHHSLNWGTPIK